jgi:Curli production assembly/transport component CsgG
MRFITSVSIAALLAASPALAANKPSKVQKMQEQAVSDVPHCARKLGTVSIADGDDPNGWTQFSLAPPAKLLKVLVQRSGCFNLVDRGTGLNAAQLERNIGNNLGLQRRSNVGQGQIKAADYVLVAEVQASNRDSGGSGIGAGIATALGGRMFGGIVGGIKTRKLEANTVLSLTNVRTTETINVQEGHAAKTDTSFGAGGFLAGAGAGGGLVGGGYENTDVGRVVTLAFIQAYAKMVTELGLVQPGDAGTAEAAPSRTFTTQGPVSLRRVAAPGGAVIRALPAGSILYPTGRKNGLWWEVADENDNTGWVLNTKLAPSN